MLTEIQRASLLSNQQQDGDVRSSTWRNYANWQVNGRPLNAAARQTFLDVHAGVLWLQVVAAYRGFPSQYPVEFAGHAVLVVMSQHPETQKRLKCWRYLHHTCGLLECPCEHKEYAQPGVRYFSCKISESGLKHAAMLRLPQQLNGMPLFYSGTDLQLCRNILTHEHTHPNIPQRTKDKLVAKLQSEFCFNLELHFRLLS